MDDLKRLMVICFLILMAEVGLGMYVKYYAEPHHLIKYASERKAEEEQEKLEQEQRKTQKELIDSSNEQKQYEDETEREKNDR